VAAKAKKKPRGRVGVVGRIKPNRGWGPVIMAYYRAGAVFPVYGPWTFKEKGSLVSLNRVCIVESTA